MRKINLDGFKLITEFEGCRLKAYKDSVGIWTIGHGHTHGVYEGQEITQEQADLLLDTDLTKFEDGVCALLRAPVNDNQFAAIVSFAFNLGLNNLGRSTLMRYVNNSRFEMAADEFHKWAMAGGQQVDGLVRRRDAERSLFLK